jgi:hypothetical protein
MTLADMIPIQGDFRNLPRGPRQSSMPSPVRARILEQSKRLLRGRLAAVLKSPLLHGRMRVRRPRASTMKDAASKRLADPAAQK